MQDLASFSSASVTPDDVEAEMAVVWAALRTDPATASKAGIPEPMLQAASPFAARRPVAGDGVLTAILVGIATDLAKDGLETAWRLYVLPHLRSKFGAKLKMM